MVEEFDQKLDLFTDGGKSGHAWPFTSTEETTHIDELNSGTGQLVGDNVEERLGAERLLLRTGLAPPRLEREQT